MTLRRFHRILGVLLFALIVNAAVTGALRANAKSLYWKDRPPVLKPSGLETPAVPVESVLTEAKRHFTKIQRVELRPLLSQTVYQVDGEGAAVKSLLMDAESGSRFLIDEARAAQIARQYVAAGAGVTKTEFVPQYQLRKKIPARPAFRVRFDDAPQTEVMVDAENGQTIVLLDQGRRFGMWMVKLHELEFGNWSHTASALLALGIVILSLTGMRLAFPGRKT